MELEDIISTSSSTADIPKERKICINAIISTDYIERIQPLLSDLTLIESPFVRTILRWAMQYYNKYQKCMDSTVIAIYEQEKPKLSEAQSKDIADFLEDISKEYVYSNYTLHNVALELDIAEEYLNVQKIKQLQKRLDKDMLTSNTTKAVQEIANFKRVSKISIGSTDITRDYSRFTRKKDEADVLFNFKGALGQMIGPVRRKHLSATVAPPKKGKTRTMVKFICEALLNGLNVFVASCEMVEDDLAMIVDAEVTRMWLEGGKAFVPHFVPAEEKKFTVKLREIDIKSSTPEEMAAAWKSLRTYTNIGELRVATWGQREATVENHIIPEMDIVMQNDNINFDVVVVDYADILMGDLKKEERHRLNGIWQNLKKLAQNYNVHVHTGSQATEELNVREDYRKIAELDWAIGLQQESEEKLAGIYRVYCIAHRHVPFSKEKGLVLLSNNGIGLMGLNSKWEYQCMDLNLELPEDHKLFIPSTDRYKQYKDIYDFI